MRDLARRRGAARVKIQDAVPYLAARFNIPAEDISAEFERGKTGWRRGREERADVLTITVKQPQDRPTLHHDMHDALREAFSAQYGAGAFNPKAMKFYFGVVENKAHTAQLLADKAGRHQRLPPPADIER